MSLRSSSELLEKVIKIGSEALTDYLDMTGDGEARDVPEFWLKSEIARKIKEIYGYYVYLEHRVRDLVKYADAGELQGPRQSGRVDIVLYEKRAVVKDAAVMALIEVKKITNPWSFNEDAARLLDIGLLWSGAHVIVAGLFVCKSSQQCHDLFRELEKSISDVQGLTAPKVISSAIGVDRWGTVSGIAGLVIQRQA